MMKRLQQTIQASLFLMFSWLVMAMICILFAGTVIIAVPILTIPQTLIFDLNLPTTLALALISLYSILLVIATLFLIYQLINFGINSLYYWQSPHPRKAKNKAYPLSKNSSRLEQFPTSDHIQDMLSHDGEIPDTAYRSKDD